MMEICKGFCIKLTKPKHILSVKLHKFAITITGQYEAPETTIRRPYPAIRTGNPQRGVRGFQPSGAGLHTVAHHHRPVVVLLRRSPAPRRPHHDCMRQRDAQRHHRM